jgi:hypothetical protein
MARSTFSQLGLPLGEGQTNMTYLYGVSDFFTVMFEDPEKVNLLMESGATACSEVYSRFLQLTSSVSLEDIQKTIHHSIKLVILKNTDLVPGELNTYYLSEDIVSSRYIANKPLLPDSLLEENVDFRLEQQDDGSVKVRFAADISNAGFSTRLQNDGTTKEYALWFVDCELDERLLSKYFGNLIALDPQASTETFKNFVYGLFYMYANGPVLDLIRKGLNLALGIPLCRGTETVLEIRKYLDTDQYVVITDANQYVIPYGLAPVVEEGQTLQISDEIARWVEMKDYLSDGDWWINLRIPSSVVPVLPQGQANRYATEGSHLDYLMREYLKKHTFLVKVKVTSFKEDQIFQELGKIIRRAKPSYTLPIYVWTVDQEDDVLLSDDGSSLRRDQFRCENLILSIEGFTRELGTTPFKRGCPIFTRFSTSKHISKLVGEDTYVNGNPDVVMGGTITGYANGVGQYRSNSEQERAWIRTILSRDNEIVTGRRSHMGFFRSIHSTTDATFNYTGAPVPTTATLGKAAPNVRIIPLYATTQADIVGKCNAIGIPAPDITQWSFDILNLTKISNEINTLGINEGLVDYTKTNLADFYNILFFRGVNTPNVKVDVNYLSNVMPDMSLQSWAPDVSEVHTGDYILGVRIYDKVVGLYWVTSNFSVKAPYANYVPSNEPLTISVNSAPQRGMITTGSSYYMLRGRGSSDYNRTGLVINEEAIDEASQAAAETIQNNFSDSANITPIGFTRSGTVKFNQLMELT